MRCPRGFGFAGRSTRGGAGLPPGPLRGPARSWLTTRRPIPNAVWPVRRGPGRAAGQGAAKAGPAYRKSPQTAQRMRLMRYRFALERMWRAARRPRDLRIASYKFASFGAPPPSQAGRNRAAARSSACLVAASNKLPLSPCARARASAWRAVRGQRRSRVEDNYASPFPPSSRFARRAGALSHKGRGEGFWRILRKVEG